MKDMKATTLSDLSDYSKGRLLELPEFGLGQPFFAYIRRPSLLSLAANGCIPNSLLSMAQRLFSKGGTATINEKPEDLKDATKVFQILAEAALIEPTYAQIKEAGLELTDDQLAFIFNYTQVGTKALESFRKQPKNNKYTCNSPEVRKAPIGNTSGT